MAPITRCNLRHTRAQAHLSCSRRRVAIAKADSLNWACNLFTGAAVAEQSVVRGTGYGSISTTEMALEANPCQRLSPPQGEQRN
jgi:hypothetical protein